MDYGPETGNLCVRFDVSDMNPPILGVTQDNADAGHVLSEGSDGVMNIGRMWLVDKYDQVVAFRKTEDNNSNSRKQTFTNIKRGEYTLYILLNSKELDGFTEGKTINEDFKQKCLTLLKPNSSSEAPEYFESPEYTVESGVPCSIVKDVAIAAGNNNVDVSLQRCVGRLTVVVLNNIHDCKLAIGGIGLSAVNPSMGYYFPQSDGSVPGYKDLAFHDLASTVVLPPGKNKIIFDRYVYETKDIPEGLSFRLFGAVYKDGATVTPGSFNSYTFTGNQSLGKDNKYFLRSAASASRNYYIGVLNDGGLGCDEFLDDEELIRNPKIENFLWTVEGTSDPRTLKNVGTKKFITLNSTGTPVDLGLGDSGTSFYFTGSTTSGYLITTSYSWRYGYGYALACDPESARGLVAIGRPNQKDNTSWILREATLDKSKTYPEYKDCVCEIPYRQHTINYIDDYGVSKLLTRIKRNEHVTVSINVSYDREYMQFDFTVKAWETKNNTTTFD